MVAKLMLAARVLRRRSDPRVSLVDALHASGESSTNNGDLASLGLAVPHLMPLGTTREELASLLGQFDLNNFAVLDDLLVCVGMGVYPVAARLNHSCAPNCVLSFEGTPARGPRIAIRTVRDVGVGEELSHS